MIVQECHGNLFEVLKAMNWVNKHYWILFSSEQRGSGGLLFLVAKSYAPLKESIVHTVYCKGRAASITVKSVSMHEVCIYGMHNFEIPAAQMRRFCRSLEDDCARACGNPLFCTTFLLGDLNLEPADAIRKSYATPCTDGDVPTNARQSPVPTGLLSHAIHQMVELRQGAPTHYNSTSDTGNILDRGFCSCPSWCFLGLFCSAATLDDPKSLHLRGMSDHAPLRITFESRVSRPRNQLPISPHVCKHPDFKRIHDLFCKDLKLDQFDVFTRWRTHKHIIRLAGEIVRNTLIDTESKSPFSKSMLLTTLARAIWRNDVELIRNIRARSQYARELVLIKDGVAQPLDAFDFANEVSQAKLDHFEKLQNQVPSLPKVKRQSQSTFLSRLAKLWGTSGRAIFLQGITTPQGTTFDKQQQLVTLTAHWRPTFAQKPIDVGRARIFLEKYAKPYDFSGVPVLNVDHFLTFFRTLIDTGVGPDGIPYSGWIAGGAESAITLLGVSDEMHSGRPIGASFNDSRIIFLTKGEKDGDDRCCMRAPHETRPLGLKNSDNKIVTGVRIFTLASAMRKSTHHTQRGFVPGRQLMQNALDLDAASRIFSNQAGDHTQTHQMSTGRQLFSATPLFDFTAAFPSISHEWINLVLEYRGFTVGLRNFFAALYFMNGAVETDSEGTLMVLFFYLSGVLQGCTASGFLFDVGLDPFLEMMDEKITIPGRGIVRACADDIGAALRDFRELRHLYEPFDIAACCAGLTLQPTKCKIIVTSCPIDDNVTQRIKAWLIRVLPQWRNFIICGAANYVGFVLGPAAGASQWDAPIRKYIAGCKSISDSGAAAAVAAHAYNTQIAPLLAYKAQLVPIDPAFTHIEITGLQKVFHLATNALSHMAFFNLHSAGGPKLKSIRAHANASLMRAAASTVPQWPEWIRQLKISSERHLSLHSACTGALSGEHWDSQAFAWNLQAAWSGFPQDRLKAEAGKLCVQLLAEKAQGCPSPGHPTFKHMQSELYNIFLCSMYPDRMTCFIRDKILRLCPSRPEVDMNVSEAFQVLQKLRRHDAMSVIKTWTNSWATSDRYHENEIFPCLLGCHCHSKYQTPISEARDALAHYYQCPVLRTFVRHAFPDIFGDKHDGRALFTSLFEHYGVTVIDPSIFKIMSCLFYAYHSIKSVRASPIESINFDACHVNFCSSLTAAARSQALRVQELDIPAILLQDAA